MAIWSELPMPVWDLIFQLLDQLLDRIRFGGVCTQFRSLVVTKQPHRLSRALLLLPSSDNNSDTHQLFNLSDGNVYETHIPELNGKWCCGSSYGWLFTVDFKSGDINLLNPISRAQISLPPLSAFTDPPELEGEEHQRDNIWFIEKATVSSSPSESDDFIVMSVITYLWSLAFCKPGSEKWTNLPRIHGPCEDVMYYKGKFYVITNWGALIIWDLSNFDAPTETTIIEPTNEIPYKRYLAESVRGELLKICRVVKRDENDNGDVNSYETVGFGIFKFDEEEKKWVSACLCSQALFLGYNRAICLSTVENPECKQHGIYFTDDNAEHYFKNPNGCNVGVYGMKDDTVEQFYENHPFWPNPCIWVTPTAHSRENEFVSSLLLW